MSTIHPTAIVESRSISTGVTVGPFSVIGPDVVLGDRVRIHSHVVLAGLVEIGEDTEVFPGAIIGKEPARSAALIREPSRGGSTRLGRGCSVGAYAIVYEDVVVGPGSLVGDHSSIREHCRIGQGCVIGSYGSLHPDCVVGDRARLLNHCHIATRTIIGEDCFLGSHVTTSSDNTFGRDGFDAARVHGPILEARVAVGTGAVILPGVRIGADAVVGAGAVVPRDVEPGTTVIGRPARRLDGADE